MSDIEDELTKALKLAHQRCGTNTEGWVWALSQKVWADLRAKDTPGATPLVEMSRTSSGIYHYRGVLIDFGLAEGWELRTPTETITRDLIMPLDWSLPIEWSDGTPAWVVPCFGALSTDQHQRDWYAVNSYHNPAGYDRQRCPNLGGSTSGVVVKINTRKPTEAAPGSPYIRNRALAPAADPEPDMVELPRNPVDELIDVLSRRAVNVLLEWEYASGKPVAQTYSTITTWIQELLDQGLVEHTGGSFTNTGASIGRGRQTEWDITPTFDGWQAIERLRCGIYDRHKRIEESRRLRDKLKDQAQAEMEQIPGWGIF